MGIFRSIKAWITAPKRAVREVKAADASKLRESGAIVLDVRENGEFAKRRVPGATHVTLGDVAERASELPKGKPIVVHCEHGRRGNAACRILAEAGHDVVNVEGGLAAWEAAGLPLEKS